MSKGKGGTSKGYILIIGFLKKVLNVIIHARYSGVRNYSN